MLIKETIIHVQSRIGIPHTWGLEFTIHM